MMKLAVEFIGIKGGIDKIGDIDAFLEGFDRFLSDREKAMEIAGHILFHPSSLSQSDIEFIADDDKWKVLEYSLERELNQIGAEQRGVWELVMAIRRIVKGFTKKEIKDGSYREMCREIFDEVREEIAGWTTLEDGLRDVFGDELIDEVNRSAGNIMKGCIDRFDKANPIEKLMLASEVIARLNLSSLDGGKRIHNGLAGYYLSGEASLEDGDVVVVADEDATPLPNSPGGLRFVVGW